jgi:Ankyrin repeats (3 copies)
MTILQLAKQKRFDELAQYLTVSSDACIAAGIDDGSFANAVAMGLHAFKGETILHLIMVYQPTEKVVDLLIRAMAKKDPHVVPEVMCDIQGRTPLTVAVIHNCDVSVIKRLLSGATASVPAVTKDSWQRLPLHWACTHSSAEVKPSLWRRTCRPQRVICYNMVEVIEALLQVYPHAAAVKDVAGMTPMEIAMRNCANPYVLQIVGVASECYKSREDPSDASTESTSFSGKPLDEVSTETFGTDCDDVSTLGSDGPSNYYRKRSNRKKKYTNTAQHRHEIVII